MAQNKTKTDQAIYRTHCVNVNKMLRQARQDEKIASFQHNLKNLFKVAKHLLEGPNDSVLPIGKMPKFQ